MQNLEIYIGKRTLSNVGVHTGVATDQGSTPDGYTFSDSSFNFANANVQIGSLATNVTTGQSTEILSVGSDNLEIEFDHIQEGDIYRVEVDYLYADIEYEKIELFKDEAVELNQNIKDFKDVSKVLSDYTQSFTVPASSVNNKVFGHYYENLITNGFDARYKYDCILKLNGIDFKKGFIRLTDVKMEGNQPHSYKIQFFGSMASLKDIMGSDDLSLLDYMEIFNHDLSFSNVRQYFSRGANVYYNSSGDPVSLVNVSSRVDEDDYSEHPDLMYPFISAENRYYYDSADSQSDIEKTRNLYVPNDSNKDIYHGLLFTDLKPAIKAIHVIKAISKQYNLTFSDDFFDEDSYIWKSMYLHCAKESGTLDKNIKETNVSIPLSDLDLSSGETELRSGSELSYLESVSRGRSGGRANYSTSYDVSFKADVTGSGSFRVEVVDSVTEKVYYDKNFDSGVSVDAINNTFSFGYGSAFSTLFSAVKKAHIVFNIYTTGGVTEGGIKDVSIKKIVRRLNTVQDDEEVLSDYDDVTPLTLSNGIDFRKNFLPKMKCIDFLKSIFKMFNLVGYFEDGVIVAKPLDEFYNNGEQYDITQYVDFSSHSIGRSSVFREVNYEFKKPKTVFAIKSNELTSDEYGNERFKDSGDRQFDGGKYDVKLGFGKMIYENIIDSDESSDTTTSLYWGYSVNESFSPTTEHPLLFCAEVDGFYKYIGSSTYHNFKLTDRNSSSGSVSDYQYQESIDNNCFIPRNYAKVNNGTDYDYLNINFGDEIFEDSNVNENSLFKKYHENYIANLYQANSRTVKIKAVLPLAMILDIQMDSRLVIQGKSYIINSIKVNLQTGKADLELITNNVFG